MLKLSWLWVSRNNLVSWQSRNNFVLWLYCHENIESCWIFRDNVGHKHCNEMAMYEGAYRNKERKECQCGSLLRRKGQRETAAKVGGLGRRRTARTKRERRDGRQVWERGRTPAEIQTPRRQWDTTPMEEMRRRQWRRWNKCSGEDEAEMKEKKGEIESRV